MSARIIVVAVLASLTVLAMVGAVFFFLPNLFTEDKESVSARRADRSSQPEDTPPTKADSQGDKSVPEVEQEVRLVGILPSPRIVRLDAPGDSQLLSVRGYYSDRSEADLDDDALAAVSFTSSDPSVVGVDSSGVVTGLGVGVSDVTLSYKDHFATVPVFVWGEMRAVPPVDPERLLEVADDGSAIVLNRVMLELEADQGTNDADELAAQIGGQAVFAYRTFPGYLVEFDGHSQEDLERALATLQADRRVAAVYPDIVLSTTQGAGNPVRNIRGSIETLRLSDEISQAYLDAGMAEAWTSLALLGPDRFNPVSIAVIDNGFAQLSRDPDIAATLEREFDHGKISVRDAVYLAGEGFGPSGPENANHGTGVTSVIVARNNPRDRNVPDNSFSGVVASVDNIDYAVTIYGIGANSTSAAITAALEDIDRFAQRIDVVNISYGFWCRRSSDTCIETLDRYHRRWHRLMNGMPDTTFVFGAGNSARDADGFLLAKLADTLPNAITVGGTAQNARYTASNFGPTITLGAPGEDVLTVHLEHSYAWSSGTSFAAPIVSGTVALLRAVDPSLTPGEIRDILVNTGQLIDVCTTDRDPCRPADQETWSKLDAGEAVSSLLWPSADAEIRLPADHVVDGVVNDHVALTVQVVNTGSEDWEFHLTGRARLETDNRSASAQLGETRHVVEAGQSHPFTLGFSSRHAGEWELELKLYRNPELTSSPDAATLTIRLQPATEAAQARPTPQAEPEQQALPLAPKRLGPNWETVSFASASAGRYYSCGVKTDGSVACWGSNSYGTASPPAGSFVSVSAGYHHSCGVKTNGSVACWGSNSYGTASPPAGSFVSVSAGYDHSCGVKTDGSVACWGSNELPAGDVVGQSTPPAGRFTSVSAGAGFTCGVKTDNSVVCWGRDPDGQASPPFGSFVSVSAGHDHSCGVKTDGSVACWGSNDESGAGSTGQASPPAGRFTSVSAGAGFTCGVRTDSSVACWGRDQDGQASPPAGSFVSVSAGFAHTCGVKSDGSTTCWGRNIHGESTLGHFIALSSGGDETCGLEPTGSVVCWGRGIYQFDHYPGLLASISVGGHDSMHACGVQTDGLVACWGSNDNGQTDPPGGRFVAVSAGGDHTCGIRSDKSVACWGDDRFWDAAPPERPFVQLDSGAEFTCGVKVGGTVACWGDDRKGNTAPPVGYFSMVSAGWAHACGVRTSGVVDCWGDDDDGQATPPGGQFILVNAGANHTCGIRTDGFAVCWGRNDDGEATAPEGEFLSLSAGSWHTCGLQSDGTTLCWGDNYHGQASPPNWSFPQHPDPPIPFAEGDTREAVEVNPVPYTSLSAGGFHVCGIQIDRSMECWGSNDQGQATPPDVRFVSVSAGFEHTCGIGIDSLVYCWGAYWDVDDWPPDSPLLSVSAGGQHACGLRLDKSVACWGSDQYGQATPPDGPFESVHAGFLHTCGVRTDGMVECWGWNEDEEGIVTGQATPPEGTFREVAGGYLHTCGIQTSGSVVCWGSNKSDEDDTVWGQATPPPGLFTSISAGPGHNCAIRADESVACWGLNEDGEGYVVGQATPPKGSFASVSAGLLHSCGIRTDGSPICWGLTPSELARWPDVRDEPGLAPEPATGQ